MLPIHVEKLSLSPDARKYLPPAPVGPRMMAAKGLAPLAPADLLSVQVVLTADADTTVGEAARTSIPNHPEAILLAAAKAIQDPPILDYLARCNLPALVREAIVLNKAVADETLVYLATNETDSRLLDILANNQARMLRHIAIAESLIENRHLSFATKKRLEEFFINDFAASILAEPEPATTGTAPTTDDFASDLAAALAVASTSDAETSRDFARELLEETPEETKVAKPNTAIESDDEKKGSLYRQILSMPVSKKIKLALKGNKEARSILIKDSNKMVSTSVLKNPRISDGEVAAIASSKSAIEDLLRLIAANNGWMRKYSIRVALVNNPKCPFAIAQKILPTLQDADVAALAKSRSVSGAVAQAAKRLVNQKAK